MSLLKPFQGDVPEDLPVEEQPEVEELDEILIPEQILTHKDKKLRGRVTRRYLVKFKNYSPLHAMWLEEGELADSPQLLQLLEAFQLEPTLVRARSGLAERRLGALPDAQEGGSTSTPLVPTGSVI